MSMTTPPSTCARPYTECRRPCRGNLVVVPIRPADHRRHVVDRARSQHGPGGPVDEVAKILRRAAASPHRREAPRRVSAADVGDRSTVHRRGAHFHPTNLGDRGSPGHRSQPRHTRRWVGSKLMGVETATRARVRADIVRLLHRGVDLPDLVHAVGRLLQRAVPFDGVCLLTVDPATMLPTGEVVENGLPPSARARLTEIELGEPDFNKFADLARATVPAASLSAATGGQLDRSRRRPRDPPSQRLRRRAAHRARRSDRELGQPDAPAGGGTTALQRRRCPVPRLARRHAG